MAIGDETSSTYRLVASVAVHRFTIEGHSAIPRIQEPVTSKPFRVGGYEWTIRYYPNGIGAADAAREHTAVFLRLNNAGEHKVTTAYSFCIEDPASPAEEKNKVTYTANFSSKAPEWGKKKFISKTDLAESGCLKNDCLVIKCTVKVITQVLIDGDQDSTGVVVPPSDLSQHLGHLLESGIATDISVKIGQCKLLKAHRCVLAARSPVFRAMLCGSMIESKENTICIDDMDATVFEVLLYYMYHDTLPGFMNDDADASETTNMAQHVLVAAELYGMDRLKLMCEDKLSNALDVNTVGFTLHFAEKYNCKQLKDCCLKYMTRDRDRLKAIVDTEGFKLLNQNYPSTACLIFVKALGN